MLRLAITLVLFVVCGCAHTFRQLTLAHDIQIPREWRGGADGPYFQDSSDAARYLEAYDRGWWWCVVHYARDPDFQPACSDYFISGRPSATYGRPAGVSAAQTRIEQLTRTYGTRKVSGLLSEYKDAELDDE